MMCAGLVGCSRADKSAPHTAPAATSTGPSADTEPPAERNGSGPAAAEASALERLEAVGTPRLRGQTQGASLKEAIAANVALRSAGGALRADKAGVARWDAAVDAGRRRLAAAALLEELEGMSLG